jgi:hypothetical protein
VLVNSLGALLGGIPSNTPSVGAVILGGRHLAERGVAHSRTFGKFVPRTWPCGACCPRRRRARPPRCRLHTVHGCRGSDREARRYSATQCADPESS